jgi:predicted site-specific integrase-resolvase
MVHYLTMKGIYNDNGSVRLLSRKQVAKIAGVHPGTVKRWERRGLLKAKRINKRVVRYEWNEVMRLLGLEET